MSTSAIIDHSHTSFLLPYLQSKSQAHGPHTSQIIQQRLGQANEHADLIFSDDASDLGFVQGGEATVIMNGPYLTIGIYSDTYAYCGQNIIDGSSRLPAQSS